MKLISLLIILVGCASGSKEKKSYTEVTNEDFKAVNKVRYKKSDDVLKKVDSEYTGVSNKESLQRVFEFDGDIDLSGEMDEIASLCYEGKYNEAKEIIKKTSLKYVDNPIFWNHVGVCFLNKNERRKALLFFNKSLALKKNYSPALNNLGVMYMREGDFSRAFVAFKRAKESKEFSRTPRLNLANLYVNFGLYKKALSELQTLYSLSKKDVDVLNLLAVSYLMSGDTKKAVDMYKKIDSDFYEKAHVGVNYSLALFVLKQKNEAIDVFEDIKDKNSAWKKYKNEVGRYIGAVK